MPDPQFDPTKLPDQVTSICREVFGSSPGPIERAGKGSNYVYRFHQDDETYLIKFASQRKQELLLYERSCIEQLHRWNLPAPALIAGSDEDSNNHWILLRSGGDNLTLLLDPYPDLIVDAGRLLASYHAMTFDAFGKIEGGEVVPNDMRRNRLTPLVNRMMRNAAEGFLPELMAEKIKQTVLSFQPVGQAVLSHGELTLPHILVENHQVKMAVDWSYMASLPAAYDLAAVELYCNISGFDFEAFLGGYGMDQQTYLNDPNRSTCRLIHAVRQFVPNQSRNYERIKIMLTQLARDLPSS